MAFKRNKKKPEMMSDKEKLAKEREFLDSADKTSEEIMLKKEVEELDKNGNPFSDNPKAPRNYKLMTARFNKYEIGILDELGKVYGVDRMNVLRIAYIALAKENGIKL